MLVVDVGWIARRFTSPRFLRRCTTLGIVAPVHVVSLRSKRKKKKQPRGLRAAAASRVCVSRVFAPFALATDSSGVHNLHLQDPSNCTRASSAHAFDAKQHINHMPGARPNRLLYQRGRESSKISRSGTSKKRGGFWLDLKSSPVVTRQNISDGPGIIPRASRIRFTQACQGRARERMDI